MPKTKTISICSVKKYCRKKKLIENWWPDRSFPSNRNAKNFVSYRIVKPLIRYQNLHFLFAKYSKYQKTRKRTTSLHRFFVLIPSLLSEVKFNRIKRCKMIVPNFYINFYNSSSFTLDRRWQRIINRSTINKLFIRINLMY